MTVKHAVQIETRTYRDAWGIFAARISYPPNSKGKIDLAKEAAFAFEAAQAFQNEAISRGQLQIEPTS